MKRILWVAFAMTLSMTRAEAGTVITVGVDPGHDYATITAGLAAAQAGDTVEVSDGVYSLGSGESFPLLVDKPVQLKNAAGARPTLQGDGEHTVLLISAPNTRIEGFRITGGMGSEGIYLMDGGGVCVFVGPDAGGSVVIHDCVIEDNACPYDETHDGSGGGVYCGGAYCTDFEVQITSSVIQRNEVRGNGGGVYCGLLSRVLIDGAWVEDNVADDRGGGVFVDSYAQTTLQTCHVNRNNTPGDPLRADWGGKGGGLFYNAYAQCEVVSCEISRNTARYFGGGVFTMSALDNVVRGSLISHNSALSVGGGVFVRGHARLRLEETTLYWNETSGTGAGAYAGESATLRCGAGCLFEGNEARFSGGGVYLDDLSQADFTGTRFLGNSCGYDGGAVYLGAGAIGAFSDCVLTYNNTARRDGAGLYCEAGSLAGLSHCTVVGNFAPRRRSGLYMEAGSGVDISDSVLWRNAGGSIQNEGGALSISYSLNEDSASSTVIDVAPGYVGWGALSAVYVDASTTGAGSGTPGDPYPDLQVGLDAFDFRLGTGSPCIGAASDGGDMGAAIGVGGVPGNTTATLSLAPGAYDIRGRNLICAFGVEGAGASLSTIRNAVFGYVEPAFVRDVSITDEALFGGITIRADVDFTRVAVHDNAAIDDGGGVYISEGFARLTTTSVTSNDSDNRGGGIYLSDGLSVELNDSLIGSNEASSHGGGLYMGSGASGAIVISQIVQNVSSAGNGGGVYGGDIDSLSVTTSVVSLNGAGQGGGLYLGGVATIAGCDIAENTASDMAGGVYAGGEMNMHASTIRENSAFSHAGGVCVAPLASAVLSGCLFERNSCIADGAAGGGLYSMGSTGAYSCEFQGNTAGYGGGFFAETNAQSYLEDCLAQANYARYNGGGVQLKFATSELLECRFYENSAWMGGGVYTRGGDATFDSCRATSNVARGANGGGASGRSSNAIWRDSIFEGNTAYNGGGAGAYTADESRYIRCQFRNNQATYGGGGVFAKNVASPAFIDCEIDSGAATEVGGGAFCLDDAHIAFENVSLTNCWSKTGGGVYAGGNSQVTFARCALTCNTAYDLTLSADGGGAYLTEQATGVFSCTRIEACFARDDGGGVGVAEGAEAELTNTIVARNTAYNAGGGVHFTGNSTGTLTNCTVASNTAVNSNGGGIYLEPDCVVAVNGSIVHHNIPDGIREDAANPLVIYSCVQKDWGSVGVITDAPLFADLDSGDYHLTSGSACIDAGDPDPAMSDGSRPPGMGETRNDMGAYGGPGNECLPLPDWTQLLRPAVTFTETNWETQPIYGLVSIFLLTEIPGVSLNVDAQLGYGPVGSDPNGWTNWVGGVFDGDEAGGAERYAATLTVPSLGVYSYAWRFRWLGGPWVYGDLDGSANGVQLDKLGTLTVGPLGGDDFDYPGFCAQEGLVLVGDASLPDCLLSLNSEATHRVGAAWRGYRFPVGAPFETDFAFRVSRNGAEGFAFVIQHDGLGALGASGGAMGYDIDNSVAVEFDTYQNLDLGDPNNNHISVQTRGNDTNSPYTSCSLGLVNSPVNLSDGSTHTARISYSSDELRVYVDQFTTPILAVGVSLPTSLNMVDDRAWIGFTGATGYGYETHEILSWSCQQGVTTPMLSPGPPPTPTSSSAKLIPEDPAPGDLFGQSVSIDGDIAIAGAQSADEVGSNAGATYVFEREESWWRQQSKLTAEDPSSSDYYGCSVSASGNTVLVGAYLSNTAAPNGGSACVYTRRDGLWRQQQQLVASDAALVDCFGWSVALNGDTAVIGAFNDDDGGINSGSAYVFTRTGDTWHQQAKLVADAPVAYDYFGRAVALDGDTAIVGSDLSDAATTNGGAAYVFVRNGDQWAQQGVLTVVDSDEYDYFGFAVDIDGDQAIVGAYGADHSGRSNAGAAYVFTREAGVWTQVAELTATDAWSSDNFGNSVALEGDRAVVGARYDDDGAGSAGSAYVFLRTASGWEQRAKLHAYDMESNRDFGVSMDLSGDDLIVGASGNDGGVGNAGAAYLFDLSTIPLYELVLGCEHGEIATTPSRDLYIYNEEVLLAATPDEGYQFIGWLGDASGVDNPTTVTMNGDKAATATFAINAYPLTTFATNGTVSRDPDLPLYGHDMQVTLTPLPDTGHHFTGWTGNATGDANPLVVTMDTTKTIEALFVINTYMLDTGVDGQGTVTEFPDQALYDHGTTVGLLATAGDYHHFTGWLGDVSGLDNPTTVTMDGDKAATATFAINTYALMVNATNGSVTRDPDQALYDYGTQVTLTPLPDTGYHFTGWSGDITSDTTPLVVVMDTSKTLQANFAINTYSLSLA